MLWNKEMPLWNTQILHEILDYLPSLCRWMILLEVPLSGAPLSGAQGWYFLLPPHIVWYATSLN